jgi:hypothetical protein
MKLPTIRGYRTLAVNFGIAIGMAALGWAGSVDWSQHLDPTTAAIVVTVVNIALRFVTTTPVGQSR